MNVNFNLTKIFIAIIIAGIAALVWWLVTAPLHQDMSIGLWAFGAVLLALYVTITDERRV